MTLSKADVINGILNKKSFFLKKETKTIFAPINIALIKYWGKMNEEINLAMTPSLAVSSNYLGTETQIFSSEEDEIILNNNNADAAFYKNVFEFVNMFRTNLNVEQKIKIITNNNVPTGSGLATSASGFGALTLALNDFFSLNLSDKESSIIARLGSGSACRSVIDSRFVIWDDAFAKPFFFQKEAKKITDNMQMMVFILDKHKKKYSSREAMKITKNLWCAGINDSYEKWLEQTKQDLLLIQQTNNWQDFGSIVEQNAMLMHKAINEAGIDYFNEKTKELLKFVKKCRENKLFIYATIDAGANVVIIYQKHDSSFLEQTIHDTKIKSKLDANILLFDN